MTAGRKQYLKCLGIAALIETIVLIFTFIPMMDGFMVHSQAAAIQRPILTQFLNWFGMVFHIPSIILAFWFPPLIPLVQVVFLSFVVYLRFLLFGQKDKTTDIFVDPEKNEIAGRYWL